MLLINDTVDTNLFNKICNLFKCILNVKKNINVCTEGEGGFFI